MDVKFKGSSEYTKEFRDPKRKHRNPDEEPFAGIGTPNLEMNCEPPIQRKKRFDTNLFSKSNMEPPLQRKKRSESASPIRQILEPELQRKKKPIEYKKTAPIAAQLTGNQNDDYMLLGDQSKFNENVKYRIRSRSAHDDDASLDHHRRPRRPDDGASRPNPSRAHPNDRPPNPVPPHNPHQRERQSRSKERGPPPRVYVDTGKPGRRGDGGKGDHGGKSNGGLRLDLGKERLPSQKGSGDAGGRERVVFDHGHKGILRKSTATQSTPRLVGQGDANNGGSNDPPVQGKGLKSNKDLDGEKTEEKRHRMDERPMKKVEEKRPTDKAANQERAAAAAANQKRTTTANRDGAATANQERGPNYAVKYRLGIAPHRSNGPIRFSEYQREFQWRDPIKSSPLISAETVVYKSHPDLTLFRSSSMAEDSEYKAQFKAWTPAQDDRRANDHPHPHPTHPMVDQPKKAKLRRSKSLKEESTQPKSRNVVVSTAATHSMATVKHAESEDGAATQGAQPTKKYRSEYSRNYVAPWNYLYDEGAWKKLHAKEGTEPDQQHQHPPRPSTAPASAAWYAEVLELRRFADEYRKRAQGTHFSREHLAQLYAKNAELWDTLSVGSVLSLKEQNRLNPNSSVAAKRSVERPQQQKSRTKSTPLLAAEEEQFSTRSESITPNGSSYSDEEKENAYPVGKTHSVPLQHQHQQRKRPHLAQTSPPHHQGHSQGRGHDQGQGEGRVVSTREFKAKYGDFEDSSRDYISDPYEGSSPGSESSGYGHQGLKVTKAKGQVVNQSKARTAEQSKRNQLKSASSVSHPSSSQMTTTMMSHGLPTQDTHVLVSSNGQDGDQHQHRHHQQHQEGHRKTSSHNSSATAAAMEFEDKSIQIQEEDLMSVSSARSLASSCSLASEVLERARSRRDEFWK